MVGDDVAAAVLDSAPEGVSHMGFIAFDVRDRVLVIEREDHPSGVTATLPRAWVQPGDSAVDVFCRCLREKVGLEATSAFPSPLVWVTENSSTFYFTGLVRDGDELPIPRGIRRSWLPLEAARARINASPNRRTRNRDRAALEVAVPVDRSLPRRVLRMVRELHRMGFGHLRAAPYMYQNGYIAPPGNWSCSVVPAIVMNSENGAISDGERLNQLRETLGITQHHDPFETRGNHRPFEWMDALFDTPAQLAKKFLSRFRDLCFIGWGGDPAYAQWYDQMLDATAPNGVFYPVHGENDRVATAYTAEDPWLPAPPPPG